MACNPPQQGLACSPIHTACMLTLRLSSSSCCAASTSMTSCSSSSSSSSMIDAKEDRTAAGGGGSACEHRQTGNPAVANRGVLPGHLLLQHYPCNISRNSRRGGGRAHQRGVNNAVSPPAAVVGRRHEAARWGQNRAQHQGGTMVRAGARSRCCCALCCSALQQHCHPSGCRYCGRRKEMKCTKEAR